MHFEGLIRHLKCKPPFFNVYINCKKANAVKFFIIVFFSFDQSVYWNIQIQYKIYSEHSLRLISQR